MNSVIEFENVSKKYGSTIALDAVSFQVPAGVVFAVLGDNGAGKTTSIKSMLGFVRPDSGSVKVLGLDPIDDEVSIRERIGYVPEQPEFYHWMRVDELGWLVAGTRPAEYFARFEKQVATFDIPIQAKISSLSKGMKAKVSLALAIAHDPEILILDEPTSGLDALVRRQFLESMVDRAATGKTVFLSSHQLNEVERVADYVAMIRQGKLLFVEKLADLKDNVLEVTLSVTETGVPFPQVPGDLIYSEQQGRRWRAIVRSNGEQQDQVGALSAQIASLPYVMACEVNKPSLEEIFIGYLSNVENDVKNGSSPDSPSTESSSVNEEVS